MAANKRKAQSEPPDASAPVPEAQPSNPDSGEPLDADGYKPSFPIVGIGGSAGGLEAITELLRALPADAGLAYVFFQHLAPTHVSMLTDILARETSMPVRQVQDQMPVERNTVYVIPPASNMGIRGGVLQLSPRERGPQRGIDQFFRSLADDQKHQAIGVVLSGSDADGTLGLEEIKAEGGITFAQDDSAQHDVMPRSAVAAGCVDFVMRPQQIAHELARIARHPYVVSPVVEPPAVPPIREPSFSQVIEMLRDAKGIDFTHYKKNTLYRRLARRMVLHKVDGLHEYIKLLQGNPGEIDALYQDILISVTSFFRNPESFEALKTTVFPALVRDRSRHEPVRIWVLGCSTGEEAYSMAMTFLEFSTAAARPVALQVFASDLNEASIEKARTGLYSKNIAHDVSPERLRRFFVDVDGSYRITKAVRDLCVFARHNVLKDPPFSHIDLISCRNLLIYLEPVYQQRIATMLHYALKPRGYLWLGNSETIGSYRDLFELEDQKHKTYVKKDGRQVPIYRPVPHTLEPIAPPVVGPFERARPPEARVTDVHREADRVMLAKYAPPGVLVSSDLEILQFRGDTGLYLAPLPGKASLNLIKMLRPGLLVGVRGALQQAKREEATVREEGLRVRTNGDFRNVDIEVIPVKSATTREQAFLILFEDPNAPTRIFARPADPEPAATVESPEEADRERVRLQQELAATREYLQSVIEQQEAANEELQSANEEVLSSNEELQSINEELETSKEEIQSSNEELATVNEELHHRNFELSQTNNDLLNLLSSVQIAIVMLGPDSRIRRFTPTAERMLNLIPADVGRPITDIKLQIDVPDLEELLAEVIDMVSVREREVKDKLGRWYSLRIRPYKTVEGKIDGAVIVLVDVDSLKRAEQALRESEARFHFLADSAPVLIWVNGPEGCQFVNRAYFEFLGVEESRVLRYGWAEFIHPDDRHTYMNTYLDALSQRQGFEAQCRMRRGDGEYRWVKSVGVPRFTAGREFLGFVGSTFDVTDLRQAAETLRRADRSKNEFLAMLAHELRSPLAPLRNAVAVLKSPNADQDIIGRAREIMERQIQSVARLIDDLLDMSRITQRKIRLRKETVDLELVLNRAVDLVKDAAESRGQRIETSYPSNPVYVDGDPVRLEQIFGNLLGNASKFTPEQGHIWITLSTTNAPGSPRPVAEVRVRDDGEGIPVDFLPQVFDLFGQLDRSLERRHSGLGIGLTVVKNLVELHGGTVQAFSGGAGQGSEFVVRLSTADALAPDAAPKETASTDASTKARRILVVDDNADSVDTLALVLRLMSHDVRVARDGPAALEIASAFFPDVVLLDIGLPGMDGFDIARQIRRQSTQPRHQLLVAVSGYGRDEDRERARQAGFDRYFVKPVDPAELQELIGKLKT